MITFKQLQEQITRAQTEAEHRALRRQFDILKIATGYKENCTRCSVNRYSLAKSLYFQLRKYNRQNDELLERDNDERLYNSRWTIRLHEENDKQESKVQALAKKLGLKIVYYSHIATLSNFNNYNIYLNFVM